jgi:hypothetical protein
MKKIIFIAVIILCVIYFSISSKEKTYPPAYWLWAGITANDAPQDSEFYVYQGLITTKYERIGLFPHPLKNKKLYLVYRLQRNLPDATAVVTIFLNGATKWQRHHLTVTGLQIDFDSPTAKLATYGDFLKKVRAQLPKQYALSITGLGDWIIHGDKQLQQSIATVTDEIVFQLYEGRHPLPDIQNYVQALKHYPSPFRIGLLMGYPDKKIIASLSKNANFYGPIYFIQK